MRRLVELGERRETISVEAVRHAVAGMLRCQPSAEPAQCGPPR